MASFNLCSVPAPLLASTGFQRHPRPVHIQGVRRTHRRLFARLRRTPDAKARICRFQEYMDVAFRLHQWRDEPDGSGRASLRNSYFRYLRGWMADSNSREAAVLKAWAESRFGLPPCHHGAPIRSLADPSYLAYRTEAARGEGRTNALRLQLDLLFEFVQDEVRRRHPGHPEVLTLYRGIHDLDEHEVTARPAPDRVVVWLNNLVSFTRDPERAWEFGTRVLEVEVPTSKIVFDAPLLHTSLLAGEEEVLALGGQVEARVRWW
ncbi:MAG: N-acyl homoserine lactonase [Candidatus Dadabacteria bacterium]|nr:MAG: N-acyl homoserine lactonase [Candidatus Dadabacteria bacterium]